LNNHLGKINLGELIGAESGHEYASQSGKQYYVYRPTLSDYIYLMPRGAQIIYPKDIGHILMHLDLHHGATVLEAGVGSGAMSLGLLSHGAKVTGVELREDHLNLARKNVLNFFGEDILGDTYRLVRGDVGEFESEVRFDRVVLDLPEPWDVLSNVRRLLRQDGVLCIYLTNVTQIVHLNEALDRYRFHSRSYVELLERPWYFKAQVARPEHRMVAHTGFLIYARPGKEVEVGMG
jgi:tRNA (adenine57-N1/adenine58-N1)-methyltransferase